MIALTRVLSLITLGSIVLVTSVASAAPEVASVVRLDGESDHGDAIYKVSGSGFDTKEQGPAVLYDFASETYENGHLNTFNRDFYEDGQALHTAYPEIDRIYDGMSIPEEEQDQYGVSRQDKPPVTYISDESEQPNRHDGVDAHYRMRNGSYIGLPMAYGGNHQGTQPDMQRRYERPDGKKELYLAWWMRPTFDPVKHARLKPASVDGDLDYGDSKRDRGERFVIPNGGAGGIDVDGWVIGKRDGDPSDSSDNADGWIEIEFDTRSNINRALGKTLVGQESGAEVTLSSDPSHIQTFTSPEKYMRAWSSGARNYGFAWGLDRIIISGEKTNAASTWFTARPKPQQWNLFESVTDMEEGVVEVWFNFEKKFELEFDPQDVATDKSPTMQVLGMHTGNFGFNTFRISEVYQDSTIQRVVLANAETLSEATHYELQRPLKWQDDSLRFALTPGALPGNSSGDTYYLFVFDKDGEHNQQGYPVSMDDGGSVTGVSPGGGSNDDGGSFDGENRSNQGQVVQGDDDDGSDGGDQSGASAGGSGSSKGATNGNTSDSADSSADAGKGDGEEGASSFGESSSDDERGAGPRPQIGQVNRAADGSGSLVVRGEGFGAEGPQVNLLRTFDGSAGERGSSGSDAAEIRTDDEHAFVGSRSAIAFDSETDYRGRLNYAVGGGGTPSGTAPFQEVYVSYAVKDLGNFPGPGGTEDSFASQASTKDVWLMLGAHGDRGQNIDDPWVGNDIAIPASSSGGNFLISGNDTNFGKERWQEKLTDNWAFGEWNQMFFHAEVDPDAPRSKGSGFFGFVNGNTFHINELSGPFMTDSEKKPYWDRVKLGAWYRGGNSDIRRLLDAVYIATGDAANARVLLGNARRLTDVTRLYHGRPVRWSSERVVADFSHASVDEDEDWFVFVFNAASRSNLTGVKLPDCSDCRVDEMVSNEPPTGSSEPSGDTADVSDNAEAATGGDGTRESVATEGRSTRQGTTTSSSASGAAGTGGSGASGGSGGGSAGGSAGGGSPGGGSGASGGMSQRAASAPRSSDATASAPVSNSEGGIGTSSGSGASADGNAAVDLSLSDINRLMSGQGDEITDGRGVDPAELESFIGRYARVRTQSGEIYQGRIGSLDGDRVELRVRVGTGYIGYGISPSEVEEVSIR